MSALQDRNQMLHDNHRVRAGLDLWVVPDFAQDTLERDPGTLLDAVYSKYPHRGKGDDIVPGAVQWVDGDNDALRIRGHPLKRQKMWLQASPTHQGYSRYNYTGWQWRVLPATGCVDDCEEVGEVLTEYNAWLDALGEGHGGQPRHPHGVPRRQLLHRAAPTRRPTFTQTRSSWW